MVRAASRWSLRMNMGYLAWVELKLCVWYLAFSITWISMSFMKFFMKMVPVSIADLNISR